MEKVSNVNHRNKQGGHYWTLGSQERLTKLLTNPKIQKIHGELDFRHGFFGQ
jgi:hypothetical protein